eukprot:jgi/Astpho2/9774/fgenesh1_pg.00149_%23_48_t
MASARRVQQGSTPAKTSGVVGQRVLMGSKAPDLVATSLSRLPNALSAEYWISKAAQEEDQGDCEAAEKTFQQALKRDVRPATDLMRAHQAFQQRQSAQQGAAGSSRAQGSVDQENMQPRSHVTGQISSSVIKSPKYSTKTGRPEPEDKAQPGDFEPSAAYSGEPEAGLETPSLDGLTPLAIHRLSMGTGQLFASAVPASAQRLPASRLRTAPRSAFKSRLQYSDGDEVPASLIKAERVPQSASHPARGQREVMGLRSEVKMRPGIELGSIALLSPVRATTRLREELGVSKVITPVRRSARKSLGGALAASMLEEHGYAYAPNEALGPRRAALFDHVDMAGPPAEDRPDGLRTRGSDALSASGNDSPSLSPTEAGIRSGLRRSARLINKTQSRLC